MFKASLTAHLGDAEWRVDMIIKKYSSRMITAEVSGMNVTFTMVFSCYEDNGAFGKWCMCIPQWNIGCEMMMNTEWNEKHIVSRGNVIEHNTMLTAADYVVHEIIMK